MSLEYFLKLPYVLRQTNGVHESLNLSGMVLEGVSSTFSTLKKDPAFQKT